MPDQDKRVFGSPSQPSYDGATPQQSDDAYASDIPSQDAADDEQVKGGMYKKLQQQLGEQ